MSRSRRLSNGDYISSKYVEYNHKPLNEILGNMADKVVYRDVAIDKQFSIPSKSGVYEQFDFPTISGYTPVAINLLNVNGGANGLCVYSLRLQNPSTLTIYNYGTGTASPYNVKIRVTYIKN